MSNTIHPETAIGLVSLSVADLERSLDYYQHHIGLALIDRVGGEALLGAGARPLLRLREQPGARLRRATGLYHFALRVPSRLELARVIAHFQQASTPVGGASDHLVSEALYLSDPDGHGIEIYRDRPRETWYDQRGQFRMDTRQLDIAGILGELRNGVPPWQGLHPDTDMGHIHLQVADIAASEHFYLALLGFGLMVHMPSASFISAGGYHHHIGMNTWAGVGLPPAPPEAARLLSYELLLPGADSLDAVLHRVRAAGIAPQPAEGGWLLHDPSQIPVVLRAA
ncbi:MAG TPA: VOC family protein [Roseiflexaceae bacterium]|nr:VOC family protein [Roseiflexaceae bacterium]